MEGLDRFTRWVIRLSLGATLAAAAALFLWNRAAALGMLMGGLGGTLGFLIMTRSAKLDPASTNMLRSFRFKWRVIRMLVYAAILVEAHRLDPERYRAFFSAAAGLLVVRVALTAVALIGLDLKQEEK